MNSKFTSIGIIGGGSWATALAKIFIDNGGAQSVYWWLRDQKKVDYIRENGQNKDYLSSVSFDMSQVTVTSDLQLCVENCDLLILAIPSAFVHGALSDLPKGIFAGRSIASAVKGLIPETSEILGDYLHRELQVPKENIAVITGPCHAEEVALEKLSYLTVGSENNELATVVSQHLNCDYIKTSVTDDIYGTEYAAVLKNIYAIAAGICHGLRFGDNFQAVLVSNAIREIKRFIAAVHPIERDIDDSAYLGDLIVTAYSQFSRNRTFGNMLGKGYSVRSAQLEMNMVAEGYYAVKTIFQMNEKLGVDMPIVDFVHAVVYEGARAKEAVDKILDRLN